MKSCTTIQRPCCIFVSWRSRKKQGLADLTESENELHDLVQEEVFEVPEPVAIYLKQIGATKIPLGKEVFLTTPDLPVTVVQGRGGYHAAAIDQDTHIIYEEVPCAGVHGDMLMALHQANGNVNIPLGVPAGTAVTEHLLGYKSAVIQARPEICRRLSMYGIMGNRFKETIPNTRINLPYLRALSIIIGERKGFRLVKMKLSQETAKGAEVQLAQLEPTSQSASEWQDNLFQLHAAFNPLRPEKKSTKLLDSI